MNETSSLKNRIVVIDNYDSFTFNLVQYLGDLKKDPLVFRNDKIDVTELSTLKPQAIIISPGPGTPEEVDYFGLSMKIIQKLSPSVPTLGVCLGHQGIAVAFGGEVRKARDLYHGKTAEIKHGGRGIFKGIPSPFSGARYHSLIVEPGSLPPDLKVTARGPGDEIMGIRHEEYPIYGVQFHPESILTKPGKTILRNFLKLEGC